MSKGYARFLSVLFCLFIGGFFLLHLALPDRERSDVENRTLQQPPAFSLRAVKEGTFMEEAEDYIADQFPFRDQWTGLKARAEQVIGKESFNGVYLCGDTLIAQVEEPEETLVDKNLGYVQSLAERVNVPVYLGLIPTAAEVWRDKLPSGAASYDQKALIDRVAALDVPAVDYLSALTEHAGEAIYYRTDHHWTTLGAYYGYTAAAEALGLETKPLGALRQVSDSFNGTLYSTSGVHWLTPDTMEAAVTGEGLNVTSYRTGKAEPAALYDESKLAEKDKYAYFLGGNQPLCVIENTALPAGKRILVIRDSYADSMAPFLAESVGELHLLDPRYYKGSVSDYVAENGIDAVLVSFSTANFVTEKSLAILTK